MLKHISRPVARITRRTLDIMEEAAEARRRGDLAAADASERAAVALLRAAPAAKQEGRAHG
jgi:hypothetical protein